MSRYYGEKPKHIVIDDIELWKTAKTLAVELDITLKDFAKKALQNYIRLLRKENGNKAS